MRYGVLKINKSAFLTERKAEDPFFANNPGYEIFHDFTKAMVAFYRIAFQFGYEYGNVYYYAQHSRDAVTIIATPELNIYDEVQDVAGPFNSVNVAYGYEYVKRMRKDDVRSEVNLQFDAGMRVVFDYQVECDERIFCRCRLADSYDFCVNIEPINKITDIKTGDELHLRVMGKPHEVRVYDSPEKLCQSEHLPSEILIPTGMFETDIGSQLASAIVTGSVKRAYLISSTDQLRYQLSVRTMYGEIDLDVKTHYEIKPGDYIYAATTLSARFPK